MAAKPVILAPVRPNVGAQAAYRRKLDALLDEMHRSTVYWITVAWKANAAALAHDASPASEMRRATRKLRRRWLRRFDQAAEELAAHFADDVRERADGALEAILRKAGVSVPFKMTAAMRNANQAAIGENVGLIKSIPQRYLDEVEGHVMRAVTKGRDLGPLAAKLEKSFAVTKSRAALIARDQNNKATAVMTRARRVDLGLFEATWLHSAGGKTPRPEHVAFSGKTFDIRKGAFLEGKWVQPGEEINCRCVSRPVIRGLT